MSRVLDANAAVADVAYRVSEVVAIYPITPASAMGEHADAWAAEGRTNLGGAVPKVVEMQSEAGAAGALHGALQAGALATTFTASQGLLLMIPDLFKIAGELLPFCMHVAARTVATHALSIFGDHSDVMAARSTGVALLASGSAQEAQDLAAVAHAATLRGRVPVIHFFDGFRTSHEMTRVEPLADDVLRALIAPEDVEAHRARAMDPDRPVLRGTSQNPDTYFQAREAVEPFYAAFADVVAKTMEKLGGLVGRVYHPFDYVGHPEAERVVVVMGSGAECAHETVAHLVDRGERVGLVKVRLFRPFSVAHFARVLPRTVVSLTVLDRTKEAGSSGEPLYQEVVTALVEAHASGLTPTIPRLANGRFGLASKELTPAMIKAVLDDMASPTPRRRFSLGIHDDVSGTSLPYDETFDIEPEDVSRALFFGIGSDGTVSANKATLTIVGEGTPLFVQGHFEFDSKKSGSVTVSHLRMSPRPIRSTYRIRKAQLVSVHDPELLERRDVLAAAMPGAKVLLNTEAPASRVWETLPEHVRAHVMARGLRLFVIDAGKVAEEAGLGRRINTVMQACYFAASGVLPEPEALALQIGAIERTWGKRGEEVVRRNVRAIEGAARLMTEVEVPGDLGPARPRRPTVPDDAPAFVRHVTRALLEGRGDDLPVSAFTVDGTWPTGTSRYEKRALARDIPVWQPELCVQCNFCSMVCPHAAIRTKVFEPERAEGAPAGFRSVPETFEPAFAGKRYVVQVAPEDCTGCGLCIEVCPAKDKHAPRRKALVSEPLAPRREADRDAFAFFESIPSVSLEGVAIDKRSAALRLPLFEYSGACAGCGETPYLRLLTQLFGDRLLVANATGCSSIYGGNLPTTPYTVDAAGRGPTWINSLFEDNAEMGLGLRLGVDVRADRAKALLARYASALPSTLVDALSSSGHGDAFVAERRRAVRDLRDRLSADGSAEARALDAVAEALVPRSVWIVGGDGWAYDIGYGGLDHVLASGADVNVLVLDTEVYSNTGGQQSKATPIGATAKFAAAGKSVPKKDLGLLAMSYGHVYVAEVAMQAKSSHAVEAMLEAERHPGPSILIAHSPCIAHGYDLLHSVEHQKRAVASGVWPLYRFDPRRLALGESPLVLDSGAPKLDVGAYMEEEARFRLVELRSKERYQELVRAAREGVRRRRALYEQLARIHMPKETSHG